MPHSIHSHMTAAVILTLLPLTPAGAAAQLQDQTQIVPNNGLADPYLRVYPWGELPTGSYDERPAFIGVEQGPDGNIYVLSRCRGNSCSGRAEPPVYKLDASGTLLASWGSGMMDFPHGFAIDREGNVWATDQRSHQAFEWSPDGELLMTIGRKGVAGDPPLLSEPTDVAIAPDGSIFITEGHSFSRGVNRVSKYAPDGTFLMSWGKTGSGPGEFNVPHTIALDSQGRVFVGDRANNRIQIFDQDGNFLDVWYQFSRPSGIAIDAHDQIYVADSESWGTDNPGWRKGIRVGDARDGSVHFLIEDLEPTAIEHTGAEGVGVDSEGNVYGAVVRRRMLEKHVLTELIDPPSDVTSAADGPTHVAHVAAAFTGTPEGRGLAATATTDAGVAMLHANFSAGDLSDLDAMRLHAGHVLHAGHPKCDYDASGLPPRGAPARAHVPDRRGVRRERGRRPRAGRRSRSPANGGAHLRAAGGRGAAEGDSVGAGRPRARELSRPAPASAARRTSSRRRPSGRTEPSHHQTRLRLPRS